MPYNLGMDIVRHIYLNEYHNRITLAIKDDDGSTTMVRYEEGTAFDEKIVDLLLDVMTFRIRVGKNVSPFLNSIVTSNSKEARETFALLNKAYGLDKQFSVYATKAELARRESAMAALRQRLYNMYREHAEGINGPRLY